MRAIVATILVAALAISSALCESGHKDHEDHEDHEDHFEISTLLAKTGLHSRHEKDDGAISNGAYVKGSRAEDLIMDPVPAPLTKNQKNYYDSLVESETKSLNKLIEDVIRKSPLRAILSNLYKMLGHFLKVVRPSEEEPDWVKPPKGFYLILADMGEAILDESEELRNKWAIKGTDVRKEPTPTNTIKRMATLFDAIGRILLDSPYGPYLNWSLGKMSDGRQFKDELVYFVATLRSTGYDFAINPGRMMLQILRQLEETPDLSAKKIGAMFWKAWRGMGKAKQGGKGETDKASSIGEDFGSSEVSNIDFDSDESGMHDEARLLDNGEKGDVKGKKNFFGSLFGRRQNGALAR